MAKEFTATFTDGDIETRVTKRKSAVWTACARISSPVNDNVVRYCFAKDAQAALSAARKEINQDKKALTANKGDAEFVEWFMKTWGTEEPTVTLAKEVTVIEN